jgi:hypothetical protein
MRSVRMSVLGLAGAALAVGAGCATAPAQTGSSDDRGCFRVSEINAITPLDDQHVFVKLSASRYQLFTVDMPCAGLEKARTIGIADASSSTRICGDGTATISFAYPAVGPTRCRIRRVEPVASKAEALELIEARASREE